MQFFKKKQNENIFFLSLQKYQNQRNEKSKNISLSCSHEWQEMKYIQEAFDANWVFLSDRM